MEISYVFGALVLFVMAVGGIWCARYEKRIWNGGICAESGLPWVRYDTSSQGCRGYRDGAGNYCWITYSVDVQPKNKL